MKNYLKQVFTFLMIGLILTTLIGCGNAIKTSAEPQKPLERWKPLGEAHNCIWHLDTHSIVKMQTEKASAPTTETIKREITSVWVKVEPIPGKEKDFMDRYGYGKDIAYGLLYYRIDKLNREFMFVQANAFKSTGILSEEFIQPLPSFKPYAAGTMVERVANELK